MTALALALVTAEAETVKAELELKNKKAEAARLREETLPNAMLELGVTELTLTSGETLSIKQEVYASIPENLKPRTFAWLEANGHGGLIKTEVAVRYGRDELACAEKLQADLREQNLPATLSRDIHNQTLRAFLREQLAAARPVPLELFGARQVWTAKVSNK